MKRFSGEIGTILIVDDEPQNIQVVGTMLAAFGYDFMIAKDGAQAIERMEAKTPDLVLLDLYMPEMNGFEVCEKLREIDGMDDVPVIFLSADNDKNTIVKALESGGVDYVTKPFNKAELLARVRTHLELKNTRDECSDLLTKTEEYLEVMAHDLKNWVGSASFSAQLLESMKDLPENATKVAKTISESTGKSLDFIEEFLANARASRTELDLDIRPVDLTQLCQTSHRLCTSLAQRKDIDLKLSLPGENVVVKSDRDAVDRILENLLSNAIKFSPPGTTVSLTLSDSPVEIVVKDEGPGFSEEDREKIFEPYVRLSAKPTGDEVSTGLGLSIVKHLTDHLAAELEIRNPETGAEIALRFPETSGE